ncbi:MAG: ABC transporter permease [Caldilineae bacterium]|nr:MAG: ABC transporter permease [Caldilineae bacterium]
MTKYIIRRFLYSIPVLFAITLFTFVVVQALPGGPFSTVGEKSMPEHMRVIMERRYGLDKPIYEQFWLYLKRLAQGDLGPMFKLRSQTVNDVVAQTWPVSIQLGVLSIILGFAIGLPAGIIAALKRNSIFDYLATFGAVLGASIPNMVLAPILILVFGVWLKWLPIAFWGADPPFILGFLPKPDLNFWSHAVMPTVALGTAISAGIARLTRASLLEVLSEDYIRTARAKGLRERVVIIRHALKNAMIPVATIVGPLLAGLLTGTFIVEQIFALNGMGRRFISSVSEREYFLLTSLTLIYAVMLVFGNLLVDITYAWLDPRIRYD